METTNTDIAYRFIEIVPLLEESLDCAKYLYPFHDIPVV